MAFRNSAEAIDDLRRALSSEETPAQVAQTLAASVHECFRTATARVTLLSSGEVATAIVGQPLPAGVTQPRIEAGQLKLGSAILPLPIFVSDPRRSRLEPEMLRYLDALSVRSYAAVAVYQGKALCGWIECWTTGEHRYWSRDDSGLLQQIADFGGLVFDKQDLKTVDAQTEVPELQAELAEMRADYKRIVEYGNLLIVRTNADFELTAIQGNTRDLLGVRPETLLNDRTVWGKFLHSPDFRDLGRKVRRMKHDPRELNEEIRIINQETGQAHWLVVRAIPLLNDAEEFCGWEGFGLDVTDRHQAREELLEQGKRIEALYEVARALQVNIDPALVTLRGLRALITATGSDCGFACFYDQDQNNLELVSSEGLSPAYVEDISRILNGPTLVRYAVENKEGLLINNVQKDTRAAVDIARKEGLKSTIIMPLLMKDEVHGALILFCRKANRYSDADFDLVSAAASQVCLAVRQAESYLAEKRQVTALGTLYRLSHELSKHMTPREVAEHAFPIIQGELSCKRMWLGVLNEQGSYLMGQAGIGPGVRRHLIDMQIELDTRHDFLDEALKKRQPVVVRAGQAMECSRLTRVLQKLNLGMFVIVPLVSLGQTVGVIIVEPALASTFMMQRKLGILTNMASEIATVILARRFEAKMADADKMRMAGLLASGVAHNFNNMLQAVMGQASLIEMQLAKDSPLIGSAKMIIEAASKGAGLIKQLLSFSMPGTSSKSTFSPNRMFTDSADLYRSVLGSAINFELRLAEEAPNVLADYGKIQQVITNLLMNAKEAIGGRDYGNVRITTRAVRLASGEVDPELAPGTYLRVDVEDNGAGMDPERLSRCFEPFFTTKNVDTRTGLGFNGSGLGLSSAYSIIKSHEGSITVSSTLGEGTVFSMYLPAAIDDSAQPTEKATAGTTRTAQAYSVFVAASELQKNLALLSTLDSFGARPMLVDGLESPAVILRDKGADIDLTIADDQTAPAGLREFIASARTRNPQMKFLIATTQPDDRAIELSAVDGVVIVGKPLSMWGVQAALKKLLSGQNADGLSGQIRIEKEYPESTPPTGKPLDKTIRKEPV